MQSRGASGKWKFISAGASVPGVSWKHDPHAVDDLLLAGLDDVEVGGISVIVPSEVALPRPASTWPSAPRASSAPYM